MIFIYSSVDNWFFFKFEGQCSLYAAILSHGTLTLRNLTAQVTLTSMLVMDIASNKLTTVNVGKNFHFLLKLRCHPTHSISSVIFGWRTPITIYPQQSLPICKIFCHSSNVSNQVITKACQLTFNTQRKPENQKLMVNEQLSSQKYRGLTGTQIKLLRNW